MSSMMDECISPNDLAAIREARLKAELAMKEVELLQVRAFIRYGLTERDTFDITSGMITRWQAAQTTSDEDVPVP